MQASRTRIFWAPLVIVMVSPSPTERTFAACAGSASSSKPAPLKPLPASSSNLQQPQQRVLWMLIPVDQTQLLSGGDRHQQWGWSNAP